MRKISSLEATVKASLNQAHGRKKKKKGGHDKSTFATDDPVDVCVDGNLPKLWNTIKRKLRLKSDFLTFSDFLALQMKFCQALETKTRLCMSGMDGVFFVSHYPWWDPLFDAYDIGVEDGESALSIYHTPRDGDSCDCEDVGPIQFLSCRAGMCACGC